MSRESRNDAPNHDQSGGIFNRTGRRHFLKQGGLVTGLAAVASAFGLTPFSPARAAADSLQSVPQIVELTGSKAERYIRRVLTSQDYQRFRRQLQQNYAEVLTIQEHATVVQSITDNQQTWIVVRIPIAGGEGHSHYAALFEGNSLMISQAQSGLLTLTPEQDIVAIVEKNGVIVANVTLTSDGQVIRGTISRSDGTNIVLNGHTVEQAIATIRPNIDPMFCCLLNQLVLVGAISIALGILLIAVCGGACVGTLGAACIACIAFWATVTGTLVGISIADCQRNPFGVADFLHC